MRLCFLSSIVHCIEIHFSSLFNGRRLYKLQCIPHYCAVKKKGIETGVRTNIFSVSNRLFNLQSEEEYAMAVLLGLDEYRKYIHIYETHTAEEIMKSEGAKWKKMSL